MIELTNKKLHDHIVAKDELVNEGRKISRDIEALEIRIKRFEEKEKKITSKVVPPKELTDEGDVTARELERLGNHLNELAAKINKFKLDAIPEDLKFDHMKLLKQKEELERERNKIALKVQKIKDKVIPIIQKELKPLLKEFEDIEAAKTKDGKVIVTTFNRVEDFKKRLAR